MAIHNMVIKENIELIGNLISLSLLSSLLPDRGGTGARLMDNMDSKLLYFLWSRPKQLITKKPMLNNTKATVIMSSHMVFDGMLYPYITNFRWLFKRHYPRDGCLTHLFYSLADRHCQWSGQPAGLDNNHLAISGLRSHVFNFSHVTEGSPLHLASPSLTYSVATISRFVFK